MKAQILDTEGKKKSEITTKLFEEPIRRDIILKIIEAEKTKQQWRPRQYAGMDRSASGNVMHTRHDWKSDRGRGMSRYPKKAMSRRGTQFTWIAAIIPSARGGRRAHPPKGYLEERKINKKEYRKAVLSALTFVGTIEEVQKKYATLHDQKIDTKFPMIVEDKILTLKTKDFLKTLKTILGGFYEVSVQKKSIRPGKGKLRGRKYKKNAGALLVISNTEKMKISGIDVVKVNELSVTDLAAGGARVTIFTEKAIKELEVLAQ